MQTASGQIEEVLGTRTRVIQRKLKDVDTLSDREARAILPEIGPLTDEEKRKRIMKKETDSTYIRHHILYHSFLCSPHLDHSGRTIQREYQMPPEKKTVVYEAVETCSAKLGRCSRLLSKDLSTRQISIVFILIIGGAFWIVNDSKAFDIGTVSFLGRARKMENNRFPAQDRSGEFLTDIHHATIQHIRGCLRDE